MTPTPPTKLTPPLAYYNEHDPFAASWLRELIKAGRIAQGVVDERSIEDVNPDELRAYTQCHFFAGIGGWSHALRLAGWPDDKPVWTGSCPCQPFSSAGKRGGAADERHLWPAFFHLISILRPDCVFGEQVASKDGLAWLDLVQADLEAEDYAVGAVDICAAGLGAPQKRQRLFFVARSKSIRRQPRRPKSDGRVSASGCGEGRLGGPLSERLEKQFRKQGVPREAAETESREAAQRTSWDDCDWLFCRDDKWRPVEPGTFPLAHGVSNRVGRLRGYGNAIVPQVAAEVIKCVMEQGERA